MHDTGIVRRVDDLGRVVIPMGIRRAMNIKIKDPFEIFVEGDRIILEKYHESCALCGVTDVPFVEFSERRVCTNCVEKIKKNF